MPQPNKPPTDPKDMTVPQISRRIEFIKRRIAKDKAEHAELGQRLMADLNLPQ